MTQAPTWRDDNMVQRFAAERPSLPHLDTMVELARTYVRRACRPVRRILDVGCGAGDTGLAFKDEYPDAELVLTDYSPPMLEEARANTTGMPDVKVIEADLNTTSIAQICEGQPVDLVVSSFAIHHVPRDRQRVIYREISDQLAPGGVFAHVEHVMSDDPAHERLFYDYLKTSRMRHHASRGEAVDERQIERDLADGQEVNILSPVQAHQVWLARADFQEAGCLFRCLEMALLVGRKPA